MNETRINRRKLQDKDIVIARNPNWINGTNSTHPFVVLLAWNNWSHDPYFQEYLEQTFEKACEVAEELAQMFHVNFRIEHGL